MKNSTIQYGYTAPDGQLQITDSNIHNVSVRVNAAGWGQGRNVVIRTSVVRDFALIFVNFWYSYFPQGLTFEHSKLNNITLGSLATIYMPASNPNYAIHLRVRNCTFNDGNLTLGYTESSVNIEGSKLQDVIISNFPPSYASYTRVTLDMSNTTFHNGAIKLPRSSVRIAYSKITLASTPLQMGGISSISCSSIRPSPSNQEANQIGVNATALQMTQSSISNFYIGLRVTPSSADSVTISRSSFRTNQLYNVDNIGAYNVNAQGNWWGTANGGAIQNKMNDYWHDIHFGQVLYANYSTTVLQAEEGCAAYDPSLSQTSATTMSYWG